MQNGLGLFRYDLLNSDRKTNDDAFMTEPQNIFFHGPHGSNTAIRPTADPWQPFVDAVKMLHGGNYVLLLFAVSCLQCPLRDRHS